MANTGRRIRYRQLHKLDNTTCPGLVVGVFFLSAFWLARLFASRLLVNSYASDSAVGGLCLMPLSVNVCIDH